MLGGLVSPDVGVLADAPAPPTPSTASFMRVASMRQRRLAALAAKARLRLAQLPHRSVASGSAVHFVRHPEPDRPRAVL